MNTDINPLSPWFVTGYAERESTFTYSRSRRGLSLYFGIHFRNADAALMNRIRRFFDGAGKIYARRAPGSAPRSPATARYYRVTRTEELLRIVAHFDMHPFQGAKRDSYEIWREMVLAKTVPEAPDPQRLELLAARLSARVPAGRSRAR